MSVFIRLVKFLDETLVVSGENDMCLQRDLLIIHVIMAGYTAHNLLLYCSPHVFQRSNVMYMYMYAGYIVLLVSFIQGGGL